ncbi:hypothetical protein Q9295_00710 [Xinfangfangia sp. CPCC 101601]|uniref:Lipoprotein n=1 Tax=Pseudogemmobacter lacusdianii TaxID=3069608 RepID=A0ABU0VT24_9RHOB|nr:hypothetical protein [Xinfangfangia sp. CPCC 101601]MDQ2064880.1 hypothetical protein [Xinfangfangia sp. CPCC 101601]
MRLAAWVAGLFFLASPAAAGCFTAEEPPAQLHFRSGGTLDYLSITEDVLTYRGSGFTSQLLHGLWPLGSESEGFTLRYTWAALPPSLAQISAQGGKARIEGSRQTNSLPAEAVVSELEIIAEEFLDWEDCRYKVLWLRKTLIIDGDVESKGEILFAPGVMIVFTTKVLDPATGEWLTHQLESLQ